MELTITQEAMNKLNEINDANYHYLLLHYDIDGCGCGVSGLPTLRFTNTKEATYQSVANKTYNVIIHHQKATFFAPKMKLDYIGNSFRLSSPEGILNPIIPEQDLFKEDVA